MSISGAGRLAGVAGWPIRHSLSPLLHGYWIGEHRVDAAYVPLAIRPEDFAEALSILPRVGFRGINVTLPHKEAAYRLVDTCDEAAAATGAVNTIIFDDVRVYGRNTDVYGFVSSLREAGLVSGAGQTATVLGAGGAGRAVIFGLLSMGFVQINLVNRTPERAEALRGVFGERVVVFDWEQMSDALCRSMLLVNATSLGMQGQEPLNLDLSCLPDNATVADIVYRPLETPLLASARQRGLRAVDGLGMLLHQAQPGFAAWFGVDPVVSQGLRASLIRALRDPGPC